MTRIWTCTWLLRVNTGPPTWWRPNVGADLNEGVLIVKAGWLRACAQVAVGIRRARDEETAERADDGCPCPEGWTCGSPACRQVKANPDLFEVRDGAVYVKPPTFLREDPTA